MSAYRQRRRLIWAGVLLGIGLGGFLDGIVLHQILQWHHLLSSQGSYPVTTVAGLQVNTLWDGLFHAGTYIATIAGLFLLWSAARQTHAPWSSKRLIGMLLTGWGAFNLVEGIVNHQLLGIHHVNETAPREQWLWWDLAFLAWGAVMLLVGSALARAEEVAIDRNRSRVADDAAQHRAAPGLARASPGVQGKTAWSNGSARPSRWLG
jgi:uncharacterized membrane protein